MTAGRAGSVLSSCACEYRKKKQQLAGTSKAPPPAETGQLCSQRKFLLFDSLPLWQAAHQLLMMTGIDLIKRRRVEQISELCLLPHSGQCVRSAYPVAAASQGENMASAGFINTINVC